MTDDIPAVDADVNPEGLCREFLHVETGRRQLSKVPDVWVPYSKNVYREHYEPIEDEK